MNPLIHASTPTILVLNASYEPLQVVTLKKALKMLHRKVAVVEQAAGDATFGPFPIPLVVRLVRYVAVRFRNMRPRWTRYGVLQRDNFTCGYCGREGRTVDHIVPVSRNGENTWENTITACRSCNAKKGAKLLSETGMRLRVTPTVPTAWEVLNITVPAWAAA